MGNPHTSRIAGYRARIDDASAMDELADLYAEFIGDDDCPATADSIRAMLLDYINDQASIYGV